MQQVERVHLYICSNPNVHVLHHDEMAAVPLHYRQALNGRLPNIIIQQWPAVPSGGTNELSHDLAFVKQTSLKPEAGPPALDCLVPNIILRRFQAEGPTSSVTSP